MTESTPTSARIAEPQVRAAKGFTLLELMVSIAIMSIIMLAFGGLLTQANVVVTEGEKRMRADAAASAISRIIRNDIRKMTKNGFLRLSADKMSMVTAGKTQSAFTEQAGDGAIIVYGWHEDAKVLYRKVLILAKDAPTDVDNQVADCLIWNDSGNNRRTLDLAELQIMGAELMKEIINQVSDESPDMAYPPRTLSQVTKTMWMVLAGGCTGLEISSRTTKEARWEEGGGTHTRHNQSSWPGAIKFKFILSSDSLVGSALARGGETGDIAYEIVCPIGH